jgi:hypothetical protein
MRRAAGSQLAWQLQLVAREAASASAAAGQRTAAREAAKASTHNGALQMAWHACVPQRHASGVAGTLWVLQAGGRRTGSSSAAARQAASAAKALAHSTSAAVLLSSRQAGTQLSQLQRCLHTSSSVPWQQAVPAAARGRGARSLRLHCSQPAHAPSSSSSRLATIGSSSAAAAAAAVASAARARAGVAAAAVSSATSSYALPSRWAAARRQVLERVEWVLGRGYHAREAFFNAIYMQVGARAGLI